MKAISLHQPWASLVATGVKTIETRSWSTKYRGPLAIHAAKRQPDQALALGPRTADGHPDPQVGWVVGWDYRPPSHPVLYRRPLPIPLTEADRDRGLPLPLGAVVATCELVDVLPIRTPGPHPDRCVELFDSGGLYILTPSAVPGNDGIVSPITEQRPYGDYTPGRYAWLLDNIQPLPEPIPFKGRQGFFEVPL